MREIGHLQQTCPIYISSAEEPLFSHWMRADTQELRRLMQPGEPLREPLQLVPYVVSQFEQMQQIPPSLPSMCIRKPTHSSTLASPITREPTGKKIWVEHLGKGKSIIINIDKGYKKKFCIKKLFSAQQATVGQTYKITLFIPMKVNLWKLRSMNHAN